MKRLGFIHDMMDVKVLILFVAARSAYPLTSGEVYELCYQDDCLSYFDVCTAIPELVKSGRHDGALTEDSIAFAGKQRAENAVAAFNRKMRRSSHVKTRIAPRESGDYGVFLTLNDEQGSLMTLELTAPDQRQAIRLAKLFEKKAEDVYGLVMTELLDEEENLDD